MNFQSASQRRRRETEITLIPLIDLFMTVLVFFILTTTFNHDTVFFVDLPQAKDAQGVGKESKVIQISVGESGDLALNNQKVNLDGIRSYLDQLAKQGKKDQPVLIRADQKVTHGKVVEVIDTVQAAGYNNLGILTREKY